MVEETEKTKRKTVEVDAELFEEILAFLNEFEKVTKTMEKGGKVGLDTALTPS